MHFDWFKTRFPVVVSAAGWLAGAVIALAATPPFPSAAGRVPAHVVSPLVIENPYMKPGPTAQQAVPHAQQQPSYTQTPHLHPPRTQPADVPPGSEPHPPHASAPVPVLGAIVDADAPVAYRLPSVSSFAPTPVDAATVSVPEIVLPPQPPSLDISTQPQTPVAAEAEREPDRPKSTNADSVEPQEQAIGSDDPRSKRSVLQRRVFAVDQPSSPAAEAMSPPAASPTLKSRDDFRVKPMSPDALPYSPATADLTSQLRPAVQRGYALAQRGALYAAQTEFVQVLRRVAQAKDAASGSDQRSRALAAGLRALDEAEDFIPDGVQLEAELDLRIVASSHRTPVLRNCPDKLLAHQAAALYFRFAESQLAYAAAGEQAGSMALHGLGKINARLAERNDDDVQFTQRATAMYAAALAARPDNHLTANELGVLLCRAGRPSEAVTLFERSIDAAPCALAYHNLAVAQQKLGLHGQAAANEQESQRLAAWERATGAVSRQAGVHWVTPGELSRVAQPTPLSQATYSAAAPNPAPAPQYNASLLPAEKSTWQKVTEFGRALPLPNLDSIKNIRNAHPETRIAHPNRAPIAAGQAQWQ